MGGGVQAVAYPLGGGDIVTVPVVEVPRMQLMIRSVFAHADSGHANRQKKIDGRQHDSPLPSPHKKDAADVSPPRFSDTACNRRALPGRTAPSAPLRAGSGVLSLHARFYTSP